MKVFERAARRAEVPLMYSSGFNPHPRMVFGSPLPVGTSSEAEYADFLIDINDPALLSEIAGTIILKLARQMPSGFEIMGAAFFNGDGGSDNIMRIICAASYKVIIPADAVIMAACPDYSLIAGLMMEREHLPVMKASKNRTAEIDIRPMVLSMETYMGEYENMVFKMLLKAGNELNLRPELVLKAAEEVCGADISDMPVLIHRTGLYARPGEKLIDPVDMPGLIRVP